MLYSTAGSCASFILDRLCGSHMYRHLAYSFWGTWDRFESGKRKAERKMFHPSPFHSSGRKRKETDGCSRREIVERCWLVVSVVSRLPVKFGKRKYRPSQESEEWRLDWWRQDNRKENCREWIATQAKGSVCFVGFYGGLDFFWSFRKFVCSSRSEYLRRDGVKKEERKSVEISV